MLDGDPSGPAERLLLRFNSLGDNCEFGMVQRLCGAEPTGLFRWASCDMGPLVQCLQANLIDFADPECFETFRLHDERGWRLRKYGFEFHTGIPISDATPEEVFAPLLRLTSQRALALARSLKASDTIFVRKGMGSHSEEEVLPLLKALRRYGPNTLLWVVEADKAHVPGTVEWRREGLLKGYIDQFAPYDAVGQVTPETWLTICQSALALWRGALLS